jgi:DNA-binding IclR family transcriptional regulator
MQSSIIAKLFSILTLISETRKPLIFSELVAQSGMNKSTVHRLLAIGLEEELVQYEKHRKTYMLGPKVFNLVRSAHQGYDIQAVALDEMLRLHARIDANVAIGIPSGTKVVYLRVLESRNANISIQRRGMLESIHCSASGKALMAFWPDNIIASRLDGYEFEQFTERTITDLDGFLQALAETRKAGFSTNDREEYDHFNGIAAPIFNYLGETIAVLNIWTAHIRYPLESLLEWSDDLIETANRITGLIGGVPPQLDPLSEPAPGPKSHES